MMDPRIVVAIASLVFSVITYFIGLHRGKRQEATRREHAWEVEMDRRKHELASKMVDEYVAMARPAYDNGPHALSRLGLDELGSDALIRKAIAEMHARSGADPWAKWAGSADGVDLVAFFKYVRDAKVDFFRTPVDKAVEQFRQQALPKAP